MKKVYIIIAILASLVLSAMFIGIGYGMSRISAPKVVYKEIPTVAPTPTPTPEVRYIYPRWEPSNIEELKKNPPEPVTETEYINHKYGYKVTFPEKWAGWFLIDDTEPDKVRICFYGKSEASRFGEYSYSERNYGISLFDIVAVETPENLWDEYHYGANEEIGRTNEKNFYWCRTYEDQKILSDAQMTNYYDEAERNLAKQDEKMLKDMLIKPRFLKETFEEI